MSKERYKTIIDEPAMEFQDIAKELKIPLSTVHWIYRKAIAKLKEANSFPPNSEDIE
jgi:predicted transcriptional regulator